jgi:hypothetical protein
MQPEGSVVLPCSMELVGDSDSDQEQLEEGVPAAGGWPLLLPGKCPHFIHAVNDWRAQMPELGALEVQ